MPGVLGMAGWLFALALYVLTGTAEGSNAFADNSYWYDWGLYGAYPQLTYESFGASSPWPNILASDPSCDDGFFFIGARGPSVQTPGPVLMDKRGNLIWTDTEWGQSMNVRGQEYKGEQYITFWHGSDNGTFGEGYYLMVNSAYEIFQNITPVGDVGGDLHEFLITPEDTALMTIYQVMPYDLTGFGISDGWIIDSLFQEVDIETGELIFEWRASDHYAISDSQADIKTSGDMAFDFFHINSVDKDTAGNYLVSSRYLCGIAYVDGSSGDVLWQLGGPKNNFTDLSGGAATDMTWQHHAAWAGNDTLTVFDNGAYNHLHTADHSRGLLISLDRDNMTARLVQDYVAPQRFIVPSQGSVQLLPDSGNVLVGWGHTPAFTEFTSDGEVLCDVHIGATRLDWLGWAKNYRTFKSPWVGRPKYPPQVAVRPSRAAVYVSWNGATEVDTWVLQSGAEEKGDDFKDHVSIAKETFETKIDLPADAGEFVRVAALDSKGEVLAHSNAVSKRENTEIPRMFAPQQHGRLAYILSIAPFGVFLLFVGVLLWYYRRGLGRASQWLRQRSFVKPLQPKYEMVPLGEESRYDV